MGPGAMKGPPGIREAPGTVWQESGRARRLHPEVLVAGMECKWASRRRPPDLSKAVKIPERYPSSRRRT